MFENLETNAIAKESELFQDHPEFMYLQTLDIATFQELRETIGDDIIFSDLITIYLNSAENLIGSIKSAFTEQDANKFALASHSLKSTSASIGATRLSLISKYLEKIGRAGEITISSEFLDFLNNEYNEVIKAIKVCILEFISQ